MRARSTSDAARIVDRDPRDPPRNGPAWSRPPSVRWQLALALVGLFVLAWIVVHLLSSIEAT